jgi:hypothetical protein
MAMVGHFQPNPKKEIQGNKFSFTYHLRDDAVNIIAFINTISKVLLGSSWGALWSRHIILLTLETRESMAGLLPLHFL